MIYLPNGQFFGETEKTLFLDGLTLTDTDYTVEKVDWHYHENPYFTFIVSGNIVEGNKKETYNCPAGTLLFHNWQEPHYNVKPEKFTRGFQIEVKADWLSGFEYDLNFLPSNLNVANPQAKLLFHKIYKESKEFDKFSALSIETLLSEVFQEISGSQELSETRPPLWVKKVDEILHENFAENLSLKTLADELNLHPVYLSRKFPKYFHCTIGEYVRKIRVEKSLRMLSRKQFSLTEIACLCGFSDQSHFIRCFKKFIGTSPKEYRKFITPQKG